MKHWLLALLFVVASGSAVDSGMLLSGTATGGGGGSGIAYVRDGFFQNAGVGSTAPLTLSGTAAGDFFAIGAFGLNDGAAATTAVSVSTTPSMTCTYSPNTLVADAVGGNVWSAIVYCMNNPTAGSVTFTLTATNSAGVQYMGLCVGEFSGVATTAAGLGIGNGKIVSANTNSVATNGNLTANNQLVFSTSVGASAAANSLGSNQIAFTSSKQCSYQIADTSGTTVTHTANYAASQDNAQSIAAFGAPGSAPPLAYIQHVAYSSSGAASSFTTGNLPSPGVNNTIVLGIGIGNGTSTVSSVTAGNGSTCHVMSGTQVTGGAGPNTALVYCTNTSATTTNFVINMSGSTAYIFADITEFSGVATTSPDENVGAGTTSASGTGLNIATNGNVLQTNDLTVSEFACGSCSTASVGSPAVAVGNMGYQLTSTAGSAVTHAWTASPAGVVSASIGALKHQ